MSKDSNNKLNVLIVDDDQFLLDIYSVKFKEGGLAVSVADSGESALEKLEENDFDIILLDVVMPSMDGLEILKRIKQENLAPNATLIILSNQGQPEDIDKAKSLGIDGYIVKASTVPSEVLDEIKEIHEDNHAGD